MNDIITIKCVFCGENKFDKIIKFKSDTIKKSLTILSYRRSKPVLRKLQSKYANIDLSVERLINEGYHSKCYRLFTAIKIPSIELEQQESICDDNALKVYKQYEYYISETSTTTQAAGTSTDEAEVSSSNGPDKNDKLTPEKCLFCEKPRKVKHRRDMPMVISKSRTLDLLKSAATEFNDIEMLDKISSYSNDSNIQYHKCCKEKYLRDISKEEDRDFLKKRKAFATAYTMLCDMLEEKVVNNNECMLFDHVKEEYQNLLIKQSILLTDTVSGVTFSDRHLETILLDSFNHKIKIISNEMKKYLVPFSASVFIT